ncbi:MAG: substrate-binding domain-containing protein, partial [Hyphomicrobiales bacterium]|nr:substrate-binding domain-containing protein [Hyphomicrobiales bacterium]
MNLRELSDHLGLSQATVSRALNGYREIRAETRARVVEAAEKYGYRPNSHARNLATGRARTLAMVFTLGTGLPLDPHFLEFLVGVSEWASVNDLSINLSTPDASREEATYRHIVRTGLADGFIVNGPRVDDPRPGWLKSLRAPYVVHGSTEPAAPDSCVDIDNEGAFARATAHLLDLGHRRIALLNGPGHYVFAAHRELGFRRACAARGVPVDPSLLFATEMTEEQGFLLGRRALAASPRPTAFLCASLILALGLLRALADAGLST